MARTQRKPAKRQRKMVQKLNKSCISNNRGGNSCHLIRLPAELRSQILKEALSQPEPIHEITINERFEEIQERNFSFAAGILRTCRQLYTEGIGYLYEDNIFDIQIFNTASDNFPQIVILNHGLDVDWVPPQLFKRARHFNITLRRKQSVYMIGRNDSWDDRQAVHGLCAILVDTVNLAKATVTINVMYEQEYGDDNDICEMVLQPFTFLRGLASVSVSGVPDDYARYVERRMMSDEPSEMVWKMKTALLDWCDHWTGDPESSISDEAANLINDCDISSFKTERARLIAELGASRHRSTQAIYRYDADFDPRVGRFDEG